MVIETKTRMALSLLFLYLDPSFFNLLDRYVIADHQLSTIIICFIFIELILIWFCIFVFIIALHN